MKKISVAIPCYEYGDLGSEVTEWCFRSLQIQKFKDFEVVISDNSKDKRIKELCERWSDILDIKYFYNPTRGAAINSNNAILKSDCDIIKFLCADDYLYDANSLKTIYENFDENTNWAFTSYVHTRDRIECYRYFVPSPISNPFVNLLGTPSAMTIRNFGLLPALELFDTSLSYGYDIEAYYRWTKVLGNPKIINQIGIVNYVWDNSVSSSVTADLIDHENKYILKKYGVSK